MTGESTLDVTIYRPVSVLPIISKLLEKLMLSRLTSFLNKNVLLAICYMEISIIFEIKINISSAGRKESSDLDTFLDFTKKIIFDFRNS